MVAEWLCGSGCADHRVAMAVLSRLPIMAVVVMWVLHGLVATEAPVSRLWQCSLASSGAQ